MQLANYAPELRRVGTGFLERCFLAGDVCTAKVICPCVRQLLAGLCRLLALFAGLGQLWKPRNRAPQLQRLHGCCSEASQLHSSPLHASFGYERLHWCIIEKDRAERLLDHDVKPQAKRQPSQVDADVSQVVVGSRVRPGLIACWQPGVPASVAAPEEDPRAARRAETCQAKRPTPAEVNDG